MVDLGACLRYYKRADIQKAIVESAQDKEVSVRYLEGSFGKRPDILINPSDVIENVKQKASSFHCSEELWINPLQISTNMKKDDVIKLRKGWDLVLDIDCPHWELAKITTWLFIEALKRHGIKSISLKFSGNKGFHIGVPFKAFPEHVPGKDILTKDYFPEGPRRIAQYLVEYIENPRNKLVIVENNDTINFGGKAKYSLQKLKEITGKDINELTYLVKDGKRIRQKIKSNKIIKYHYPCTCGNTEVLDIEVDYIKCRKCSSLVRPLTAEKDKITGERRFNSSSIINVDTILIASRHLYRSVYSLHEKSGLASVPIDINRILLFEKDEAKADNVKISNIAFLDDAHAGKGEAEMLLRQSFDFNPIIDTEEQEKKIKKAYNITENITQKVPEELFPPCVQNLLKGLKDGRKRSLFILINFLTTAGWTHDEVKERLYEWNKANFEPLRENLLITHINYHKLQKKDIPAPNCPKRSDNVPLIHQQNYYVDLQVCNPDLLCARCKNPVQYAKKKAWLLNQNKKKRSKKNV